MIRAFSLLLFALLAAVPSVSAAAVTYITPSAGAGGTISPALRQTLSPGGEVTVTATPNEGYDIARVLVDGVSQEVSADGWSRNFAYDGASHRVKAIFARKVFPITLQPGGGGKITPLRATAPYGSRLRFSIKADKGYEIEGVELNGAAQGSVSSVIVPAVAGPVAVSATFRKIPPTAPGSVYGELTRGLYFLGMGGAYGSQKLHFEWEQGIVSSNFQYDAANGTWITLSSTASSAANPNVLNLTSSGWQPFPGGTSEVTFDETGGAHLVNPVTGRGHLLTYMTEDVSGRPLTQVLRYPLAFEAKLPKGSLLVRPVQTADQDQYTLYKTMQAAGAPAPGVIPFFYPSGGTEWLTLNGLQLQFGAGETSGATTFRRESRTLDVQGDWELRTVNGETLLLLTIPETLRTSDYLGNWIPDGTVLVGASGGSSYFGEFRPAGVPLPRQLRYLNSTAFKVFQTKFQHQATLPDEKLPWYRGTLYRWNSEDYPMRLSLYFDGSGIPQSGYFDAHADAQGNPCDYAEDNTCKGVSGNLTLVSGEGDTLTYTSEYGTLQGSLSGGIMSGKWLYRTTRSSDFFARYEFIQRNPGELP